MPSLRRALIAASLAFAPIAVAAPAHAEAVALGDGTFRFEAPPGQCRLSSSASHFDDFVLRGMREVMRETATVIAVYFLCETLNRARRGKPSTTGFDSVTISIERGPHGPNRVFGASRGAFLAGTSDESMIARWLEAARIEDKVLKGYMPGADKIRAEWPHVVARDDIAIYMLVPARLRAEGVTGDLHGFVATTIAYGYRLRVEWWFELKNAPAPEEALAKVQAYMAALDSLNEAAAATAVPDPADQPQAVAARSGDAGTPDTGIGFDVGRALTSLLMGAALVGAGLLLVALFRRLRAG